MSFFSSKIRAGLALCLLACGKEDDHVTVAVAAQLSQKVVDPSQVQSYQLWVLDQSGKDNTPVVCDALLKRTITPDAANVITLKGPIEGESAAAPVSIADIKPGANRVFYVDLFKQPGLIERIGVGCTQSVTIAAGKVVTVAISIEAPSK